jgi:PAS domain S-box-containing protein
MNDKIKILLLEDNDGDVILIREMLTQASDNGFDLHRVSRLAEGVQQVARDDFDLALVDLGLPDSQGLETFEEVYARTTDLPIIVLSGLADESVAVDAVRAGAQDYLIKAQINADLLTRAIRYAIERNRVDKALRRRNRELALINHATRAFTSTIDLEEVLDTVLEEVQHLLHKGTCSVWLVDLQTNELICHQSTDTDKDIVQGWSLAPGEGIAGWVAQHGESLVVPDTRADERHFDEVGKKTGSEIRSILAVPLQIQEGVIGVVEVVETKPRRFKQADLRVIEPLAASAAIAIENARLYKQAQQEIAERKRVEQALREGEKRFRTVSALISDFAYGLHVDEENNLELEWGTEALALTFGFTIDEVRARGGWESLAHPDDLSKFQEHLQSYLRGEADVSEYRVLTQGNQVRWVRDYGQPIRDEGHTVYIYGAMQDITEQREMEEALRQARDRALEASRLKSQLLAVVSHELRTPLGAILGYTEFLHEGAYGEISAKQEEILGKVMDSTNYLNDLVDQLLDQAQIDAGQAKLNIAPFAPREMIDRAESKSLMKAHSQGLELIFEVEDNVPETLIGDEQRLEQILLNLVGNAIKFTDEGEVRVRIYRSDDNHWAISVSDTGPGVPPAMQDKIFEPFRQVDSSATRSHGGVGLGLSIVKQLTTLMGGNISLESTVGEGSTFTISLPLTPQEEIV